jgi:hypothetical protein
MELLTQYEVLHPVIAILSLTLGKLHRYTWSLLAKQIEGYSFAEAVVTLFTQ